MNSNDIRININDLMRIIQETVQGKQITMAHVIASPDSIIYQKLGLDPKIDFKKEICSDYEENTYDCRRFYRRL